MFLVRPIPLPSICPCYFLSRGTLIDAPVRTVMASPVLRLRCPCFLVPMWTIVIAPGGVPSPWGIFSEDISSPQFIPNGSSESRAALPQKDPEHLLFCFSSPWARSTRGTWLCKRRAPRCSRPSRGDRTSGTPRPPRPARAPWPV